jgi:hypothetical protein
MQHLGPDEVADEQLVQEGLEPEAVRASASR